MGLAGCEDVDASVTWKEPDAGESTGCAERNLGGVDRVETARREDIDAFVSVEARCRIGASFLEETSLEDVEVDDGCRSRNEVSNVTAGVFVSSLGVRAGKFSSSGPCSSLAGGDGGGGPTLFEAAPDWTNRAGWERSGLGAGPDVMGVDRSDRPTL